MWTELHWIEGAWPGRLSISARPRGGEWLEDELLHWKRAGVKVVTSLLEKKEEIDLDLELEGQLCTRLGMKFYSLPIADREAPPADPAVDRLIEALRKRLDRGHNVSIHCRQGIGRAATLAAALLIARGLSPREAIQRIADARGGPVPETDPQRAWLEHLGSAIHTRG